MKTKIYFLVIAFAFLTTLCNGQTVTSTANGNWMNPLTWSCFCVPVLGFNATSININTNVVLDTSMIVPVGALSVQYNGSLIDDANGRDLYINGGNFSNYGTTDVRYIYQQSGPINNYDTMYVKALSTNADFNNYGWMLNVDSLLTNGSSLNTGKISVHTFYNATTFQNQGAITDAVRTTNAGTFINQGGASQFSDSITNIGSYANFGRFGAYQFTNIGTFTNIDLVTFYNCTNSGFFTNSDSLIGVQDLYNSGSITNNSGAVTLLGENFMNSDSANYDAVFTNEGKVSVGTNFYNVDTVTGVAGYFYVQELSANSGYMKGSFDFCDLTPPANAPYIDYNTGTVSPNITWCTATTVNNVAQKKEFSIYPNPAGNTLNIATAENFYLAEIFNTTGEKIYSGSNNEQVDLSLISSGMYIFIAKDISGNILYRQRFIKE